MPEVAIEVEPARQAEVVDLIDQSDAYLSALYPAESRHAIKRLFVATAARGRGIGRTLMAELERRAAQAGVTRLQLETGVRQPEALALYRAFGYLERGPFGRYRPDRLCLFMEKRL